MGEVDEIHKNYMVLIANRTELEILLFVLKGLRPASPITTFLRSTGQVSLEMPLLAKGWSL